MTFHQPDRPPRVLLVGLPHPLTRALAAWVWDVLAACDRPFEGVLATDERDVAANEAALYLRCDAVAGLSLVASLEHVPGGSAACAPAARLDDRWQGLPRLSAERTASSPAHAVVTLASCLDVAITTAMLAAADAALPALRAAVAVFGHPLAFALALDPSPAQAGTTAPIPDASMSVDSTAGLDGIDGEPLSEVLARLRLLEASGTVGGRERSSAAAARVAARVVACDGSWAVRILVLAGERWAALPAREFCCGA